mgnify:CR=1 FL=1
MNLYKYLCSEKKEFVLSKQLLRSGTSVGENVRESEHAVSKNDFINKLAIAQKEINETIYWLEIPRTPSHTAAIQRLRFPDSGR